MATPNSQSFNSFPISCYYFCLIFVRVDIVPMLVDLCKIMGVVVSTLNNDKIGCRNLTLGPSVRMQLTLPKVGK